MFGFWKRKARRRDKAAEPQNTGNTGSAAPGEGAEKQGLPAADAAVLPAFGYLLTSQLAAFWLDGGREEYRAEYLRRLRMCGLSRENAEKMLAFEADILKRYPRPELLKEDFIAARLFDLTTPFFSEPLRYYKTNFVYPFSYVVKLSDEAEWHYWNHHEKKLFDPVWNEINWLSDRNRLIFQPFAEHLVEHMGWTVENVNAFSYNEQGMLDKLRWGKTITAAAQDPWGLGDLLRLRGGAAVPVKPAEPPKQSVAAVSPKPAEPPKQRATVYAKYAEPLKKRLTLRDVMNEAQISYLEEHRWKSEDLEKEPPTRSGDVYRWGDTGECHYEIELENGVYVLFECERADRWAYYASEDFAETLIALDFLWAGYKWDRCSEPGDDGFVCGRMIEDGVSLIDEGERIAVYACCRGRSLTVADRSVKDGNRQQVWDEMTCRAGQASAAYKEYEALYDDLVERGVLKEERRFFMMESYFYYIMRQ